MVMPVSPSVFKGLFYAESDGSGGANPVKNTVKKDNPVAEKSEKKLATHFKGLSDLLEALDEKKLFGDQYSAFQNERAKKYSKLSVALYGIASVLAGKKVSPEWAAKKIERWLSDSTLLTDRQVAHPVRMRLIKLLQQAPKNQDAKFKAAVEIFLAALKKSYLPKPVSPKNQTSVSPAVVAPAIPGSSSPRPANPASSRLVLKVTDGAQLQAALADLPAGKLALVAFSADWSPAGQEYKRAFRDLAEKYRDQFVMIFAEGIKGHPAKIKTGTEKDWQAYGVDGYPAVALINSRGQVTGVVDKTDPEKSLGIANTASVERRLRMYASAFRQEQNSPARVLDIQQALAMLKKNVGLEALAVAEKFSRLREPNLRWVGATLLQQVRKSQPTSALPLSDDNPVPSVVPEIPPVTNTNSQGAPQSHGPRGDADLPPVTIGPLGTSGGAKEAITNDKTEVVLPEPKLSVEDTSTSGKNSAVAKFVQSGTKPPEWGRIAKAVDRQLYTSLKNMVVGAKSVRVKISANLDYSRGKLILGYSELKVSPEGPKAAVEAVLKSQLLGLEAKISLDADSSKLPVKISWVSKI